jgi:hypothetical protein
VSVAALSVLELAFAMALFTELNKLERTGTGTVWRLGKDNAGGVDRVRFARQSLR